MKYKKFNFRPYEAHMLVLNWIEPKSFVLDLGCATGYFGRELKKRGCQIIGVESDKLSAKIAERYCKQVIVLDLEQPTVRIEDKFDYILLLDVLEHLRNREQLLISIHKWLKPHGVLVISTPNIAHISVRLKLILGDFTYSNSGILDSNHLHFFTEKTLKKELMICGWLPQVKTVSADFGQLPFFGRFLRHISKIFQYKMTTMIPTLLGVQFVWKCRPISKHENV